MGLHGGGWVVGEWIAQILAEVECMVRIVGEDDFTNIQVEENRIGDSGGCLKLLVYCRIFDLIYTTIAHKSFQEERGWYVEQWYIVCRCVMCTM